MEVIIESGDMTFYRDGDGCLKMIKTRHLKEQPDNYSIYAKKIPDGGPLTLKDDMSDEVYFAVFGLDRSKPYPFNEIVDGKRYSTENAAFVCRYVRIVVGYEPNYGKWKRHGRPSHKYTGELFRTAKGTWFAIKSFEEGLIGIRLNRCLSEDDIKKIIETTIPAQYEDFFAVEEA